MNKRVVTIGGGTGHYSLLKALVEIPNIDICAIVAMADSGGSTGILRDQYGVLPPGDILKCLIALSPLKDARDILQTRFSKHVQLKNHNAGNLLLTFLTEHTSGNFPAAVTALGEILQVQGTVLPVTIDKTTLVAELSDGSKLYGEAIIDVPRGKRYGKIINTYLVPHSGNLRVYPSVITAIDGADVIILGPGDLYTSIIPNLLITEVPKNILKNKKAKYVYILNLMTKYGETNNFSPADFLSIIAKYVPRKFDYMIMNSKLPNVKIVKKYLRQNAHFIKPSRTQNKRHLIKDLLSETGDIVRHDIEKLATTLHEVIHG